MDKTLSVETINLSANIIIDSKCSWRNSQRISTQRGNRIYVENAWFL